MRSTVNNLHSGLSLRANFSWTLLGNLVYAGCQWGMLVVLAKLGSPAMVGQFSLGLVVTAPVFMLTNLQLRGVQATDAVREYYFGDYLSLRLITTVLALVIIAGVALTSRYRLEVILVVLMLGLAKAIEAVSDIFYGLLQQHERMDCIARSMIIRGFLSLLLLSAGIWLTGSLFWGVLGLAVGWAVVLLGYDLPNGVLVLRGVPGQWGSISVLTDLMMASHCLRELRILVSLARKALPLGVVMMLISLNTNIPRYFIEQSQGVYHLGVFAALAYLIVAGSTVVGALGQSASPRLAKYYAAGNGSAFRDLLLKLTCIGVLMGIAGTLLARVAGQEILTLLYQPEYAAHSDVFVLLMISAGLGFVASFLGYGMTAARYFRVQLPFFLVVTGTTALACAWMIPSRGLYGAAIALIISSVVQFIGSGAILVYALRALQTRSRNS